MVHFSSFNNNLNIAVIGASGGIGLAFVDALTANSQVERIYAFSRSSHSFDNSKVISAHIDLIDENTIMEAAESISESLDLVIVSAGILHDGDMKPEKALKELSAENFEKIFAINTVGPALVAKHFVPKLSRNGKSVFAALSARVGSISDNQMGGWYAYRASKAALNMLIKNTAIEATRKYKDAAIIALHPGTVDTNLSAPFQGFVKPGKLFTTEYAAESLLKVIDDVSASDTGKLFAWDGEEVAP